MSRRPVRIGRPRCGGRNCHVLTFAGGSSRRWEEHDSSTCPDPIDRQAPPRFVPEEPSTRALTACIVLVVVLVVLWLAFYWQFRHWPADF